MYRTGSQKISSHITLRIEENSIAVNSEVDSIIMKNEDSENHMLTFQWSKLVLI